MLYLVCKEIRNFFDKGQPKYFGTITIENGELIDAVTDLLKEGQYFRIVGSTFNDGVYKHPASSLKDEIFNGAVWGMAVPKEVEELAEKIGEWQNKYGAADSHANSPYSSESFAGYSYTKASGNGAESGAQSGWRATFASELDLWRKL